MPRQSLLEFLHEYQNLGRNTAFVQNAGYRTDSWTYSDVAETGAQCAREFERLGIAPGERILLQGRNSAQWVAAFFGCILRGAIAVPMDHGASVDFTRRVAQQVDGKVFVVDRRDAPAERSASGSRPVILLDSLREVVGQHSRAPYPSPALGRDSTAQIVFTSGSTAVPKGVVISHGNILANLEPLEAQIAAYRKWARLVHPLRFLNLVPASHVLGQFMGVWIPPLVGGCVHFQDSLNPSEIISTVRKRKISVLVAVPRVLEALQGKLQRDLEAEGSLGDFQNDFAAAEGEKFWRRMWRFRTLHRQLGWKFWAVLSGGATLDPEVENFWNRTGFAAIQGYGLTETASLVSVNHPFRVARGSIGKALPGRDVKVDESGEILVRGENVSSGYWGDGESAVEGTTGGQSGEAGWFRTGDLGSVDADGNLYFKGRKKSVIVTAAGVNVHPEDLEASLRREPEVKDCVVVGIARRGNAEPCGVLLLRDETRQKQPRHAAGIMARVNESLAEHQRMRSWFLWPEADFPRTPTGKPRIAEIRAAVEAQWGNGGNGAAAAAWPATTGGVGELIARLQGSSGEFDPNANLENDLHLTSLDRVELLGALEDRYQVDLNETRFAAARTVGEVERLLKGSAAAEIGTGTRAGTRTEFIFPRWAQRWPVSWVRALVYHLLVWPATHLLAHPRVSGRENLRGVKGPALVICNHVIYLDVGFVLAALPMRLRQRLAVAMGGERLAEMRRPPAGVPFMRSCVQRLNYFLLVSLFNVFPLPKKSGFRESFRFAGDLADRGWSVLVFPEGDLTPDGKLQAFRDGIGLLAANLKIPVVPMRIDGAYEIREAGSMFNRPGRIQVHIGAPIDFATGMEPREFTRSLEQRVAELGRTSEPKEIAKAHSVGE